MGSIYKRGNLKSPTTFAYKTGWRVSEITGLTWSQVDLTENVVWLETGSTKSGSGRTVYLDDELRQLIKDQQERQKRAGELSPWVFPGQDGRGKIKYYRKSWKTACKNAGVGKKLFQDFRRTAVRNMVRVGISERVAMMVSGHKTRSVFDRYDIVNATDLKLASKQLAAHLEAQNGYKKVTIVDFYKKMKPAITAKILIFKGINTTVKADFIMLKGLQLLSCVTICFNWCPRQGSNLRHMD